MENRDGKYDIDWELVFNSINDAVFIADVDNAIIKANISFAKLLKMDIKDVIGKKCYELMHKTHTPWPECPFEKSKKDAMVHVEEVNDPAIGVPLLVTTSPILNKEGKMIGVVHVSKDITNIKKAEEELRGKITELQHFKKITVGRELKMKELKTKIARLESVITDNKQRES